MEMPMEASEFASTMLERLKVITRMNQYKFPLEFLKEFGLTQMMACCDRMEASAVREPPSTEIVQKELVQNPAFASYWAELVPFIPEDKLPEPAPTPVYARYGYGRRNYVRSAEPASSKRSEFMRNFYGLLTACQNTGQDITVYPVRTLVDVLALHIVDNMIRLTFLKNYTASELTEEQRKTVIASLRHCSELPLELNTKQRRLLLEPCVASCRMFESAPFLEISNLLDNSPALLDIMRMLNQYGIKDPLTIKNYTVLAQNTTEYHQLLRTIIGQMDTDAAESFLDYWKKGGCSLWELRRMERWAASHSEQNWDNLFSTYSSYINQLYGKRFKAIDLSAVAGYQESILIYAITSQKKRFIQLVDACAESFLALPYTSVIFQETLYHENFNLNELTETDLEDCAWMNCRKLPVSHLSPGRRYTFPELRALYAAESAYFAVYHALKLPRQDDRLKVLQQLRKRDVLWEDMTDQEVNALADCLDQKPVYDWLYHEFSHIRYLTVKDAARMLAHWSDLQQLVPSMETQADTLIALRSPAVSKRFSNMAELKLNIVQADIDWQSLSSVMDLSQEFLELNWENIENFLFNNGASIAETYRKCLEKDDEAAFLRVVKAELMGKLDELKYFDGDLQRELDISISKQVAETWKENLCIHGKDLAVGEYDDFFSTMLLGIQPSVTCLSYLDGIYKSCLLSSFDSNKKVLYVKLNGRIVGRAFLRLTKGRLTNSATNTAVGHHFTFVDLENTQEVRQESLYEQLTLFLERPYISGVGPEVNRSIERLLVKLARQKAEALGTLLVLSTDYRKNCGESFVRTQFDIYISKSKGTEQYLDSLDGRATVSKENSYKTNTFLILN